MVMMGYMITFLLITDPEVSPPTANHQPLQVLFTDAVLTATACTPAYHHQVRYTYTVYSLNNYLPHLW